MNIFKNEQNTQAMLNSFLRLSLIASVFLFFSNNAFSQRVKQPKFGKISMDQLKKTSYEKFPDAHAVKLFDYGSTTYEWHQGSGLQMVYNKHVAIHFLDQEAFDHTTFEIGLYRSGSVADRVGSIKAVSYNLDGKGKYSQSKLEKKDIFSEEINDLWTIKKFTMPNVKEGTIIELKYSVTSGRVAALRDWQFQDVIPTLYSEYFITMPEFFTFNKNFKGFVAPYIAKPSNNRREGYNSTQEGWIMTDVPAFEMEDYMRSYTNYMSEIEFELFSVQFPNGGFQTFTKSWDQISQSLMKSTSFGVQIRKAGFLKEEIKNIKTKHSEPQDQVVAIYEFIKRKISWNGKTGEFAQNGIKKAFNQEQGNSGDINLMLVSALRTAGFDAKPVVMSTRNNGMLPITYPSFDKLNYVIASVNLDGKRLLLDATEDNIPAGLLPIRCFNGSAIIVDKDAAQEITIGINKKRKAVSQSTLEISEDGTLTGSIKKSKANYAALDFRRKYDKSENEDDLIKTMENENEGLTVNSYEFTNVDNIYKNIKEVYDVTIDNKVEMTDDLIYLNPMLFDAVTENPFKLEKRAFPVDFAVPIENTYMFKLKIPEGYTVESVPEKSIIELDKKSCQFTYTNTVNNGELSITSRIKINQPVFVESDYQYLKEFYNLIIKKHAEQIVLKKQS